MDESRADVSEYLVLIQEWAAGRVGTGICVGSKVLEIRGRHGSLTRMPGRGLNQKCFSASRNPDGSWTIKQIPLKKQ